MVASPRRVAAVPLTPEAYFPYGHVLQASPRGEAGRSVNEGTGQCFDRLAPMLNLRGDQAPLNICVFRSLPRLSFPLAVQVLERHPFSTQVFVPMNARRYLVMAAQGGDSPDLDSLVAFVATGAQGISYHPGTWHHPLIALDQVTDFVCFIHEDGSPGDCHLVSLSGDEQPQVVVPGT